jgi:membrane-bound inhibitor of C-type lysozyme
MTTRMAKGIASGIASGMKSGIQSDGVDRRGKARAPALGGWLGEALAAGLLVGLPAGAWAEAGIRADYLCKGRFDASEITAFFFNDTPSAVVLLEGEGATRLPRTVSASGVRYSDGEQSFWVKGDRASWQRGQAPARACEPRSPQADSIR